MDASESFAKVFYIYIGRGFGVFFNGNVIINKRELINFLS